jgi:hypothetical protein
MEAGPLACFVKSKLSNYLLYLRAATTSLILAISSFPRSDMLSGPKLKIRYPSGEYGGPGSGAPFSHALMQFSLVGSTYQGKARERNA